MSRLAVGFAFGFVLCGAVAVHAGCSGGEQADVGINEPIQISGSGAQFISGPLPGSPPGGGSTEAEAGAAEVEGGAAVPPLSVTSVSFQNSTLISGINGTSVSGLVTTGGVSSVGVQLENQGTGYWVVPLQAADVQFPGQSDFGFSLSLNPGDAPGQTHLRFVAIAPDGTAGQQTNAPICIESRVPDNGHACAPYKKVPAAVLSLTWNTDFDVDLHVVTPDGRDVNAKTAGTTIPLDSDIVPPTVGHIDRDSIGDCVIDGWREEDLVFQDFPPSGNYLIYAAPFESCGQEAVIFTLNIYAPGADGNLHSTFTRSGELLANDVTGGTSAGLFVVTKEYE